MAVFERYITSVDQLSDVSKALLEGFPQARIFAFYGEMGAGKTTLIKALCNELHVIDVVNSPTFAIINEYRTNHRQPIFHFDFYRLKNLREACDLGCEEYFYSENYCFLEWAELIEPLLPPHFLKIEINVVDPLSRRIIATQIS